MPTSSAPLTAAQLSELDHTPIGFGQYRAYTPAQIAEFDPGYLCWTVENVLNRPTFVSEVLYKACVPLRARKKKPATALSDVKQMDHGKRQIKVYPSGSLAESRSHFDSHNPEDDEPF